MATKESYIIIQDQVKEDDGEEKKEYDQRVRSIKEFDDIFKKSELIPFNFRRPKESCKGFLPTVLYALYPEEWRQKCQIH